MKKEFHLIKEIINLSESDNWDIAKKEWDIFDVFETEKGEFETCLCGKYPIKNVIKIKNKNNFNIVTVGNCCINKVLGIKDYNKIFNALKKNKINSLMIEQSKKVLTEWEYNFILSIWRKRKLTQKQDYFYGKIKKKILNFYKNKRGDLTND